VASERSLGELAARLGAELRGPVDDVVDRVDTLERASAGAVSFFSNRRYHADLRATKASVVLIHRDDADDCPVSALVLDNPYLGYAQVAAWLNPPAPVVPGHHPSAIVHVDADIDSTASIGPHCVVGAGSVIGPQVSLGPGCIIEDNVTIGANSRLVARVTVLTHVCIGARAVLHPGVVIGAQGFGIANDNGVWVNIPQLGAVIIGDDVDIGANSCVDRGALEDTVIEHGVKIDNHVQIGHNVRIGANTAIAGCVAIAGSARIGARCTIGGTSAVSGHLEITDDVHLTGGTNVPKSISEPGVYSSTLPLQSNRDWRRNVTRVKQLDALVKRVRALERKSDE
jgi:UDP-3-O-[3-hydroxymyristoyl] glucosamine N-acyltransferase